MLVETIKWWKYASLFDEIVTELINFGVILTEDNIINIDINVPKRFGSDIAIWVDKVPNNNDVIYPKTSPLLRTTIINNVINIWVNREYALNLILSKFNKDPSKQGFGVNLTSSATIAIEHTSLNTVFPINLATFRGTVIGDASRCFLLMQGASVKSHFFVEDLSKRNHVLLTGVKISDFSSKRLSVLSGKPDHEIGYLYASTVMSYKRPGTDNREVLSKMFPKALSKVNVDSCSGIETFHWSEYAFAAIFEDLKSYCIKGFEETLKTCSIHVDEYDHEARIYSHSIRDDTESYLTLPTPSERNICYFKYLASASSFVISILPISLMHTPNYQESLVGTVIKTIIDNNSIHEFERRFLFSPYGKVDIIGTYGDTPVSDSISEGIFTSLDSYLENLSLNNEVQSTDIVNSIKLTFLGQDKNSSSLVFNTKLNEKGVYFEIVNVLKRASGILLRKDIPYSNDTEWSEAEKTLLINLLSFEKYTYLQLYHIPEFGKLVKTIKMIAKLVDNILRNTNLSNMLFSNQKVLLIIATYSILNVFESLGVTSSEGSLLRDIRNNINQIM